MSKLTTTAVIATAALGVTTNVHAEDQVKPVAETNVTASAETTIEGVKAQLDQAEQKAKESAKAVADQEKITKDANTEFIKAESLKLDTENEIAKLNDTLEQATPEAIAKAAEAVNTAEAELDAATSDISAHEAAVTEAESAEKAQAEVIKDANADVAAKEEAVTAAEDAVKVAEDLLAGTGITEATKAVETAETAVNDATATVTEAETAVAEATKADQARALKVDAAQTAYDQAVAANQNPALTEAVTKATANATAAKSELDTANKALDQAKSDLKKAEDALADAEVVETPSIKLPDWYKLHGMDKSGRGSSTVTLEKVKDWMRKNNATPGGWDDVLVFDINRHTSKADREHLVDLNNISDEDKIEINQFYIQLLNRVRQQYRKVHGDTNGRIRVFIDEDPNQQDYIAEDSVVTKDTALAGFAVADRYKETNVFMRHTNARFEIDPKYNVNFSGENLVSSYISSSEVASGYITMARLKEIMHDSMARFLINTNELDHAYISLLYSSGGSLPSIHHVHAVGLSFFPEENSLLLVEVAGSYTGQDDPNAIPNTFEKADALNGVASLKQKVEDAKANVTKATATVTNAKDAVIATEAALKDAKAVQARAQEAVSKAKATLDRAKATPEQLPAAERQLDTAKARLETAKASLESAKEALALVNSSQEEKTNKLKEAKADLVNATVALNEAKAKAKTETDKLTALALVTAEKKASLNTANARVEKAKASLTEAKAHHDALVNVERSLEDANARLAELKEAWLKAADVFVAERDKLEALKAADKPIQDEHKKLLSTYKAMIFARDEALRLKREEDAKRLEAERKAKEAEAAKKAKEAQDKANKDKAAQPSTPTAPDYKELADKVEALEDKAKALQDQADKANFTYKPSFYTAATTTDKDEETPQTYSRVAKHHSLPKTSSQQSALTAIGLVLSSTLLMGYRKRKTTR